MADDPLRAALEAALGAQYHIVRLIGKGGMGAVYLGHERLLDRPVAIKVLPHETADATDARDRFLREARIAARLTHPNIVPLFSFGEAGKTLFYVMGYVEGESLEQRLRRDGRLPHDETRRILGEIASALEHAHSFGIVHRDLKPDNVLLETSTGRAVLADFGIARQGGMRGVTLTHTGVIIGTPHYMSPEQASGDRDIDGRSDLYALGVIGYRMISGRLPFEGASVQEVITQHIARDPIPLSVVAPDVPADLDGAIARCLAKDPDSRWNNAAALKESLATSDASVALPDEMERLPSIGSSFLLYGGMASLVALAVSLATRDWDWLKVMGWMWAALPIVLGLHIFNGRKARIPWQRVLQMAFWQPKRWGYWWPRALRRPGDVWDRLPKPLRRVRAAISAFGGFVLGVSVPAFILGGALIIPWANDPAATDLGRLVSSILLGAFFGQMTGVLGVVGAWAYGLRWLRGKGIKGPEAGKLLLGPTFESRVWARPDVARLLGPEHSSRIAGPENPRQIVSAIEQSASASDSLVRPMIEEAAAAAREMLRALDAIDHELRELARHGDAAERAQLEKKLATLGAAGPQESPATTSMRALFESQLALLRDLAERSEQLADRRSRYGEMLRTLWLQISVLKSQRAVDATSASDVSGKIRQLVRDAAGLADADRSVQELLPQLDTPTTPLPR
jgi:serine/threonine protein kinase